MLPRFHLADLSTIGHYLGVLIMLAGLLMAPPAVVAFACGEYDSLAGFSLGMGLCLLVGSLLLLLPSQRLTRRCLLLLMGLSWVVVALCASVPLYLSGDFDSYVNALFDAVSSITTTGISLASDVEHMATSQIVFRTLLTLVGAGGVIAVAFIFRLFGEGGDTRVVKKRGQGGTRGRAGWLQTLRLIVGVLGFYLALGTVLVFALGVYLGLGPLDALVEALCLVSSALGTSSYTPHAAGLVFYHSIGLEAVLAAFMLLGAVNFAVFSFVLRGRADVPRKDAELRFYVVWLLLLVAFVTISLAGTPCADSLAGLFANGIFPTISAATTAGLSSIYPEQFGTAIDETALLLLALAFLLGACTHSTGGGIKGMRVVLVLRWMLYSVLSTVLPRNARVRVKYEHYGPKGLTAQAATAAMTTSLLYILAAALGTMLFIAHGNDSIRSVFEAVSYVSNGGATSGLTSADMGLDLKLAAMLLMWMGRVEFVAVLAVVASLLLGLRPEQLRQGRRMRKLLGGRRTQRGGKAWRNRKQRPAPAGGAGPAGGSGPVACVCAVLLAGAVAAALVGAPYALAESSDLGNAQVPATDIATLGDDEAYRALTVQELLESTERLEGKLVQVKGEVVGAALRADDGHVWVNILQNGATIGVYLTSEQAAKIGVYGDYDAKGDTLVIQGYYHLACEEHACELEVHASSVKVKKEGHGLSHSFSHGVFWAGLGLIGASALVLAVRTGLRHRSSKGGARSFWQ